MVDKLNSQKFGERGKPADPDDYLRKAVMPELPATEAGDTGSGLMPGTPRVDSLGRPKGTATGAEKKKGGKK